MWEYLQNDLLMQHEINKFTRFLPNKISTHKRCTVAPVISGTRRSRNLHFLLKSSIAGVRKFHPLHSLGAVPPSGRKRTFQGSAVGRRRT